MNERLARHFDSCIYCMGEYLCPNAVRIVTSIISEKDEKTKEIEKDERIKELENVIEDFLKKVVHYDGGYWWAEEELSKVLKKGRRVK